MLRQIEHDARPDENKINKTRIDLRNIASAEFTIQSNTKCIALTKDYNYEKYYYKI